MKKLVIVLTILLITFTLPTYFASNASAQENQSPIDASQVKKVSMGHADLVYLPLFGDRKEDNGKIISLTKLLNEVLLKGEVYSDYVPPEMSFFDTDITLQMRDGTYYNFTFEGGGIVFFHEEVPFIYRGVEVSNKLLAYMVDTTRNHIEKTDYRIGETIRQFGNDAYVEKGIMMASLTPILVSGRYSSEDPSYQLMFTAPITFGRYDFDIPIPAFAINPEGKWVSIKPGEYLLYGITNIKAPSKPTLSINGQLLIEPKYQPIVRNGSTLIPLRSVAEALGWKVGWHASTNVVTLNKEPLTATDATIIKGTTYVPLRSAAKALGLSVDWEPTTNSAHLIVNPKLFDLGVYEEDSNEEPIAALFNNYVILFNQRDDRGLYEVSGEGFHQNSAYSEMGYRYISSVDGLKLVTKLDGSIIASATFTYLFDAKGIRSEDKSFHFKFEEDRWKMSPVTT